MRMRGTIVSNEELIILALFMNAFSNDRLGFGGDNIEPLWWETRILSSHLKPVKLLRMSEFIKTYRKCPKNARQTAALRSWCNHDPCCRVR
ncbi:unnamed protein product [Hymenolepis diminuta]|uniref:Uncharacterized protein n=1 Tax=Hymenolepis diminuta TaxID=6216 RepID=A0A564YNU6_HYMDI|nr:unnamed protein product [Hymenolepis diminuta]